MAETASQVNTSAEADVNQDASQRVEQPDLLEHLLKPEVQASLNELIENLPKLTEVLNLMTKAYDLGLAVATDKVLIEDMSGGIKEFAKPVIHSVKHYASAVMEANERAIHDQSTIGLFGIMRMLKDPQMQKMLRVAQAFLNVLSEREKSNHA